MSLCFVDDGLTPYKYLSITPKIGRWFGAVVADRRVAASRSDVTDVVFDQPRPLFRLCQVRYRRTLGVFLPGHTHASTNRYSYADPVSFGIWNRQQEQATSPGEACRKEAWDVKGSGEENQCHISWQYQALGIRLTNVFFLHPGWVCLSLQ